MDLIVAGGHGRYRVAFWPDDHDHLDGEPIDAAGLAERIEAAGPAVRVVWADTAASYPGLLAAGVRVGRCADLRLCHAVLRSSVLTDGSELAGAPDGPWDVAARPAEGGPTLLDELEAPGTGPAELPLPELVAEHRRQLAAVDGSSSPGRLRLLLAAESSGALAAAEMRHVGLPWSVHVHDRRLTELLGPRPLPGARPAVLEELVGRLRTLLGVPGLNPDSQPALLAALRAAGIEVRSTRKGELERVDHPAVEVLLRYKQLARLLAANGWAWMDAWVVDGRFHAEYLPSGVVSGRWAAIGGGALQLPKQLRSAVVADPGWKLVVADAAQLEPRVLAAMSGDEAMARASRGVDLYSALVADGIVPTRPQAKVAMLGALYGSTTGDSGALMPALRRAYPRATGYVDQAARAGELGQRVSTWLGRTSPLPGPRWREIQQRAGQPDATAADERAARRQASEWGRFTRNFVVQGTAAEWASCWLATIRRELHRIAADPGPGSADRGRPELVYFLHDEVMVHTPADRADEVAGIVRAAAVEAGRLLFGSFGVEFAVELAIVDDYGQAK